jgi:hypothetical protein
LVRWFLVCFVVLGVWAFSPFPFPLCGLHLIRFSTPFIDNIGCPFSRLPPLGRGCGFRVAGSRVFAAGLVGCLCRFILGHPAAAMTPLVERP